MVCSVASASTRRPWPTAVADVTGPIDTHEGLRIGERRDRGAEVVDGRRRRERHRVDLPACTRAIAAASGVAGTVRYTGSTSTV